MQLYSYADVGRRTKWWSIVKNCGKIAILLRPRGLRRRD